MSIFPPIVARHRDPQLEQLHMEAKLRLTNSKVLSLSALTTAPQVTQ